MTNVFDAQQITPLDMVATVLRSVARQEAVTVKGELEDIKLVAVTSVPRGHKIALKDLAAGGEVIKYGQVIGRAVREIKAGEHVHIHNLEGIRGRGDQEGAL